ncbi:MAG: alpha/beta hydrolase [Rhodospirillaceae bacterium]|nr:alpha/beta hydrolase [Rhodospirillaceae bacterium]MBT5243258.1 alpha/beta hydrolase [Rhodospirillaceae bacterium]MBT5563958.1 alpha/beta hydrolase [Rhodospirillaceae bacterium]MBT6240838.1 alpha/beta hydrolase [Rhodospirillaceae bacterium]
MQSIDVNGRKVAFLDEGSGKTIVLLHSSTGSHRQWKAATTDWSDQYRIIAPDLLGYGDTEPWPGPRPHTLANEVEIVAAVINRTDDPVHLVGHSYGGAIALQTAMKLGSRIASLSLIEPTAFYLLAQEDDTEHEPMTELTEIVGVVRDIGKSVVTGFPMAAAQRFVEYWCGEEAWSNLSPDRKWRTSNQMHKVHQDFHALLCEKSPLIALAEIKTPTLILCGTDSPRPTRRLTRIIAEAIPGSRHSTIPHAGHMLPITHAAKVNALILEHVQRVEGQTSESSPAVVTFFPKRVAAQGMRFADA